MLHGGKELDILARNGRTRSKVRVTSIPLGNTEGGGILSESQTNERGVRESKNRSLSTLSDCHEPWNALGPIQGNGFPRVFLVCLNRVCFVSDLVKG